MIYLKSISDSIVNAHWKYFKASDGYSRLLQLSKDTSIPSAEKDYFLRLTNESLLKSIIFGRPEQLRQEIEYYQTIITPKHPFLKFHQTFLSFLNWENIYTQINRQAEQNTSKANVTQNRQKFYDGFIGLIDKINHPPLKSGFKKGKLTIQNIETMYNSLKAFFKTQLGGFYNRIFSVFDYDDFIKEKEEWYAYSLTRELGINVCPYCNRNYIHTSVSKHGRTRPELDHFYPKSKYPFLSISLYNLTPSCHVCNSNLKGAKDFYIEKHLHPYQDNFLNDFRFEIVYRDDSIDSIVPDVNAFDINLKILTEKPEIAELINNSNNTFQFTQLHNFHKDIAQELLVRSVHYNKTKIDELKRLLGDDKGINNEFLKRVIIGNYGDIGSFGKRPLAKYSYDILSKTDLIDNLNHSE